MKQKKTDLPKTDIAIIGMGCIFPESRHLKEYWHLLFNGIDAISDIPDDTHWNLKDYFNQDPSTPDHTYCKRGGFLPSITFDPLRYGIPPNNLEATDTSQLLGLEVARMALEDAGYPINHPDLEAKNVNVILGVTGTQELVIPLGARLGHPIWKKALEDSGIREEKRDEVIQRIQGDYVQWQENSFPGLLGNVVAGRIANRLNLSGTNTVSDAACASSLSAIHTAVMELTLGKCDMSITGGVDALNDIFMHMCFSKTGVLSPTSDARPFSKDADGTVLGEGIGMLILKRLEDAQRDKDRIYAVIKGIGTSSDGKTSAIYAPDSKGQLKALKKAYDEAEIDPSSVGLVEAHGTGTRVGDKTEFDALKDCFETPAEKNRTAVGSVKSMIGHTKAAAGVAGMIKTALCLYNKVLPPTLKAQKPDPEIDINNSAFYLNPGSKPWLCGSSSDPRRAGVSAFGFGGSNFHVVLEEYTPIKSHVSWDGSIQIIAFSSNTKEGLFEHIKIFKSHLDGSDDIQEQRDIIAWQSSKLRKAFSSEHGFRLLIIHKKEGNIHTDLDNSIDTLETDDLHSNIYCSSGPKKGKLGFLFPGQGSQHTGMGKDLFSVFPEAMDALELANQLFSKENHLENQKALHDYIFPLPSYLNPNKNCEDELRGTDIAQPAIGAVSLAMVKILKKFNVTPDMTCGHSFGELSALYSAGWMDEKTFLSLAVSRGRHMADSSSGDLDPGSMLAIKAPLKDIEALVKNEKLDLVLANKNCQNQGVLSGATDEILRARTLCKSKKIRAVKLPVAAAFHSRLVENAVAPFKEDVKCKTFSPTAIDVLSNSTGKVYDTKKAAIIKLLGNQLANPVNFLDNIKTMSENQVSTFIEVGPKAVLSGLGKSILQDQNASFVSLDGSTKQTGVEKLAHTLCLIASNGFAIDLTPWEDAAEKPTPKKMKVQLSGANLKPTNRCTLPVSKSDSTQEQDRINQKPAERNPAREDLKGSEMSIHNRQKTPNDGKTMEKINTQEAMNYPAAIEAMKLVQKGLDAMQQLQAQTARAHEKFLETQAEASKTLAGMMEQTQTLNTGQTSNTVSAVTPVPAVPAPSAPVNNTHVPFGEPASSREIFYKEDLNPPEVSPTVQTMVHPTPSPTDTPADTPAETHRVETSRNPGNTALPVTPGNEQDDNPINKETEQILFGIVSDLTGFPVEMLEPSMDIESDLGIDSIKKVEIISELEKQIPSCEGLTTESISSVRTLKDICRIIEDEVTPSEVHVETEDEKKIKPDIPVKTQQGSRQTITIVLLDTISELTGFPVEMLEPSMNLESDLGVDSIKRVEILSKLEQELDGIDTISSDDIGNLKTIQEIIDYLVKEDPEPDPGPPKKEPKYESVKKIQGKTKEKKTVISDRKLTRQTVSLKEYPTNQIRFYNGAKIDLPDQKKVYITRGNAKICNRFKKEFENIGISAESIDITKGSIPDLPDAAGIVIVSDPFNKKDRDDAKDRDDSLAFLKAAFLLAKKNAGYLATSGNEKGAFFTTVSFLGGDFGFSKQPFSSNPNYGGLAGLTKTAALEWNNVLCRALDMPESKEKCLENAEAAVALMLTQGSVEMGLDGDSCNIPTLTDKKISSDRLNLNQDDVVVITGGAKGVTAACAIELAREYSPTIVLIGRSRPPFSEPEWAGDIHDPAQLKKAILSHEFTGRVPKPADLEKVYQNITSNREIHTNIKKMKQFGSKVEYISTDIRDSRKIDTIFQSIRQKFNGITAVIHGAGVLEDKRIIDKEIDAFTHVLETKVKGLEAVLSASRQDQLKYLILFSSIAARTGNQGQCDYAIANEILNKTAQKLQGDLSDCKVLSMNWGPWEGGMVDASLKKAFIKRGIDLIPLKAGARQLLIEMGNNEMEGPEIIIGAQLTSPKKTKKQKLSLAMKQTIGLDSAPVLAAHKIAGEPVVPFAFLMEFKAEAAEKNNPGLVFTGMDNIRLLKGVKPGTNEIDLKINLGKCKPGEHGFEATGNVTSMDSKGQSFIHSNARIILKEKRPAPPVLSKAAFMALKPYPLTVEQAYATVLFHGKALQGIQAINGYSKKGIEVVSSMAPAPSKWFRQSASKWCIEPMMLDAAFQAAILWSYERIGQVCLPSFIANLRLYSSFDGLKGNIRILFTVNEETKSKIIGYFTFLDESGSVVASITGFEAVTDPSLLEKFRNKPLFSRESILAFAQGNPSKAFGKKYKIFDNTRQIARLPKPPYFFMDRVMSCDHPQWELKPGGWIEVEYDIPEGAWYFSANRTHTLPFCILLEIALQPCGWLAAYAGSALESEERLHFRNLGGKALLAKSISSDSGTITIRTRMTDVSKAGGMIIQSFEMEVLKGNDIFYKGDTDFGFFTGASLSNQVGIRNSRFLAYTLPESCMKNNRIHHFRDMAPLVPEDKNIDENDGMPSKALRMIDEIEMISFDGGLYENGYIKGIKTIEPSEWFFKAHFYQDPVCPGSLGVESFLQMIRFFLLEKYDIHPDEYESRMQMDQTHEWIYRGQIIPDNKKVEIHAHIKEADQENENYKVTADGALVVDGICIYEMHNFSLSFVKTGQKYPATKKKKSPRKNKVTINPSIKVIHEIKKGL